MSASNKDAEALASKADAAAQRLDEVKSSIGKAIIGLDEVVERSLAVILTGSLRATRSRSLAGQHWKI